MSVSSIASDEKHAGYFPGGDDAVVDRQLTSLSKGNDPDEAPELTWRTWVPAVAAAIGFGVALYGVTVPPSVLRSVTADIGGANIDFWTIQATLLVPACLSPAIGLSSDLFGRRGLLFFGLFFGCLGSLISFLATNIQTLIAGRVIFSVYVAFQVIQIAIPSEVLPRRWRSIGQALANFFPGLFSAVGLVLAGVFTKYSTWRWVFRVEFIAMLLSTIMFFFAYHPRERPATRELRDLSLVAKIQRCDPIGTFLFIGAAAPFIMGLAWLNNPYPSSSAHVVGPIVAGIVMFLVFALYEWKVEKNGILSHDLFSRGRNFSLALIGIFGEGIPFLIFNTFYPQETALVWETDPILIGLRTATLFLCVMPGVVFLGFYVAKTRRVKDALISCFACLIAAAIGLALAGPGSGKAAIGYAVLSGYGYAGPIMLLAVVAQLGTPAHLIGLSTALLLAVRSIGASVGVAIATAVFDSKIAVKLPGSLIPVILQNGISPTEIPTVIGLVTTFDAKDLGAFLAQQPAIQPQMIPAVIGELFSAQTSAFSSSLSYVWWISVPFLVVAVAAILCFADIAPTMTYKVDAPAESLRSSHHVDEENAQPMEEL